MGLRLRKSFKLGPVRINLSKSGVGYSYGVKGYRVTHKATGGVRTTASIPGTGISYVTETSAKKAQSEKRTYTKPTIKETSYEAVGLTREEVLSAPQKKPVGRYAQVTGKDGVTRYVGYMRCPYCGTEILETAVQCYKCKKNLKKGSSGGKAPKIAAAVLAGVVAIGGVGSMLGGDDEPAATPAPDPAPIVQQETPSRVPASVVDKITVDPAPVPEPEPVVDEPPVIAEPEPAPEPDPTPAPAPVTPEPAPEPEQPAEKKEYVGNRNSKILHETWCDSVDRMKETNKVQLFGLQESIALGYDPCENCTPE